MDVFVGDLRFPGDLDAPPGARGLVLFAHGSGSSRFSPRNVFVPRGLHAAGLATLLFDLLTEREDRVYEVQVLDAAELFARAIARIHGGGSLVELLEE